MRKKSVREKTGEKSKEREVKKGFVDTHDEKLDVDKERRVLLATWRKRHAEKKIREESGPSGYRGSPSVTVTPSNRSRYFAHVPRTCESPPPRGGGRKSDREEENEKKKNSKGKEEKPAAGRITRAYVPITRRPRSDSRDADQSGETGLSQRDGDGRRAGDAQAVPTVVPTR